MQPVLRADEVARREEERVLELRGRLTDGFLAQGGELSWVELGQVRRARVDVPHKEGIRALPEPACYVPVVLPCLMGFAGLLLATLLVILLRVKRKSLW